MHGVAEKEHHIQHRVYGIHTCASQIVVTHNIGRINYEGECDKDAATVLQRAKDMSFLLLLFLLPSYLQNGSTIHCQVCEA